VINRECLTVSTLSSIFFAKLSQAQAPASAGWLSLPYFYLIQPPLARPPVRNSSEIAGDQLENLITILGLVFES
jgi:hypothetical protein